MPIHQFPNEGQKPTLQVQQAFAVAVASLAKELLEIEATGNRARAEAWFKKYGTMPAGLTAALSKTGSVPVDVDPITSFGETVR